MTSSSFRAGLAALALGGLTASASAQAPTVPAPAATPQVIRWPGGYMVLNGPEVILRSAAPGGSSTNVITGSGNGIGNRIVVSGGPGVTVVQNSRNGIGNQVIVEDGGVFVDIDALIAGLKLPAPIVPAIPPAAVEPVPGVPAKPPAMAPAPVEPAPAAQGPTTPPSYKGKASPFWTKKAFSDAYDCNLYWCPTTKMWFRYIAEEDTYRPVPKQPEPLTEEK